MSGARRTHPQVTMVDDKLFSKDEQSFKQYAMTPEPEQIQPDSLYRDQRVNEFESKLADNPGVIVLTHNDADGLTSAALVEHYYSGNPTSDEREVAVETVMYDGPFTLSDALEVVNGWSGHFDVLYILDFNFDDRDEAIEQIEKAGKSGKFNEIICYDHHQWQSDIDLFPGRTFQLTVDEDECASTICAEELFASYPLDDHLEELAEVTKDYDLWIRDDPRSGQLEAFASIAEPEEYIDTVLEHGVDFPEDVERRIQAQEQENEMLIEVAVDEAEWMEVAGLDVAVTYIGKGPNSEIGNELVENHKYDVAFILKPHGGVSIRSHSDEEGFTRCHEVAEELGGGGHPTAAGFGIEFESFQDLAGYWAPGKEKAAPLISQAIHDAMRESDRE